MTADVIEFFRILAQCLLLLFETIRIALVAMYRFPLRSIAGAGFIAASAVASFYVVVGVLTYTVAALVSWNVLGRLVASMTGDLRLTAAYQAVAGRRIYSAWRRWWLYERRWQRTLAGQHLTRIVDSGYDDVPGLGKVTCTRSGDVVRVKVLPGQTPVDFTGHDQQTAKSLAKAFKARECRVTDIPQTDYIKLELLRGKDLLAQVVPFPGIPQSAADVDLRRIPIGIDERGRQIRTPLHGSHTLVVGQTGAGKGSVFWSTILHLEPLIREGSVELWAADPKGGVELNPGRNLFAEFAYTDEAIQALLAKGVARMKDNLAFMKSQGQRKLVPTPERPLTIIYFDELGLLAGDKKIGELVRQLVNVGRAPGVIVVGAVQNGTKEVVRDRDEYPVKIVLRQENQDTIRKILGRAAYLAGARPDEIPKSMPGVGYAKVDESADELEEDAVPRWLSWLPWVSPADASTAMAPRRFRAYWVPDDLIKEVNASFASAIEPEPEDVEPTQFDVEASAEEEVVDAVVLELPGA